MIISLIVAIGKNYEIGLKNNLLWHIPGDLKHFKSITKEHCVVMGRKTYESIGRPLPKRTNLVLSSNPSLQIDGCTVLPSLNSAIEFAKESGESELFVIGGERVYKEGLSIADRLYLTRVDYEGEADAFFPDFEKEHWSLVEESDMLEEKGFHYKFQQFKRIS